MFHSCNNGCINRQKTGIFVLYHITSIYFHPEPSDKIWQLLNIWKEQNPALSGILLLKGNGFDQTKIIKSVEM